MDNIKNYISILIESLNKKIKILDSILQENEKQKQSVENGKMDEDLFNETLQNKDQQIQNLNELDAGFNAVYDRIKEEIVKNSSLYTDEINTLKELISTITEKSMEVQLSEKRNQRLVEKQFRELRKETKKTKIANKAATDYYKNMSNLNIVEPQFVDKKK